MEKQTKQRPQKRNRQHLPRLIKTEVHKHTQRRSFNKKPKQTEISEINRCESLSQPLQPHIDYILEVSRNRNSSIFEKDLSLTFRTNVRCWDKPRQSVIPPSCKSVSPGGPGLSTQSHFSLSSSCLKRSWSSPLAAGL